MDHEEPSGPSEDDQEVESQRRWDELIHHLKNRPEVLNPGSSFPNDPRNRGMNETDSSSEEEIGNPIEESSSEIEEDPNSRIGKISWCLCGNCKEMPTEKESICCQEVEEIKRQIPEESVCITYNNEITTECTDNQRVDLNFRFADTTLRNYPNDADLLR
ncbi:hypothetical protein GDO86_011336 [Hymenochirus boettgeri]|uniref:P2X purinoceptor 7-like n=1 Tax=Hymenochirus boettgeri TaxID=247094 RepID=A0A8T2JDV4_9PIPI|nr:hypothetical protein GDO86_011336 [Hymenochirus boettgeri]